MQHNSLKDITRILKQEGTSQDERYMPALHETGSLMDNRRLEDIIAWMQQYASKVSFINTVNNPKDNKQNWQHFFYNDILFLIADVATTNTAHIKKTFEDLTADYELHSDAGNFIKMLEFVFSVFKKINDWYLSSFTEESLKQEFSIYIQSFLKKEIENIKEIIFYFFNTDEYRERTKHLRDLLLSFDAIWGKLNNEKSDIKNEIFLGDDEQTKINHAAYVLSQAFNTTYQATQAIAKRCSQIFQQTINLQNKTTGNHNPHAALTIAFLKLYNYNRIELNKIPEKLLHFYYRDVLQIKNKRAVADKTFVVFELVKGFDAAEIKKGTKFSAGKDAGGNELIYATEKTAYINKATVQSLKTIYTAKDAGDKTLNYYVRGVDKKAVQAIIAEKKLWSLPGIFGNTDRNNIADFGFAIASSQLYLAKGERTVVITFSTTNNIGQLNEPLENTETDLFDTNIIKLLLTGEKGWLSSDVEENKLHINSIKKIDNSTIELSFTVSVKQEQSIIAFDTKIHGGNFNTAFPLLQLLLKYPQNIHDDDNADAVKIKENQVNQLNILQNISVENIEIKVQVGNIEPKVSFNGINDLILENDETVIDSKKAFFPFSPIPKVGSSFYIGCKDLFYKKIENAIINIEWLLPDNFKNYYQRYFPPYDSNKFIATLSILTDKRWRKIARVSVIDTSTTNPKLRLLRINNVEALRADVSSIPESEIAEYDTTKKDGTLRLKLEYPDFGHSIYPQLITSAVMEKANNSASTDYYKIVKKRLHDSVISIKLPGDLDDTSGTIKVIYDILNQVNDDERAKTMIINALSDILRRFNGEEILVKKSAQGVEESVEVTSIDEGRRLVNDDKLKKGFIRRTLAALAKKVIGEDEDVDREKYSVEETIEKVDKEILEKADFIMPSEKDQVNVILNETNAAINRTVANIADELLELKAQKTLEPAAVKKLLDEEFDKANKVINDMIAKKISILLITNEVPAAPYTPVIKKIAVSYSSKKNLHAKDGDKVLHISPLGISEAGVLDTENNSSDGDELNNEENLKSYIFPTFLLASNNKKWKGLFFIGIKDLLPNQNISLLLQVAEGTRQNDKKPPQTTWFGSTNNSWIKFKSDNIIADSSYNFQTTGVIEFAPPPHVNNNNSFFNMQNLTWFCAGVEDSVEDFPNLIDVKSQAVNVVFQNNNNSFHTNSFLEAGKIKAPVDSLPQVKSVMQPVTSTGGKPAEDDETYFVRVSERLRHKERAINNWDFERLVLQEFPLLYKVKCLNNYYNGHFANGHVTIVPVANIHNIEPTGKGGVAPRINFIDLKKIENFAAGISSPYAKIHAVNPLLEYVLVTCKIKFYTGLDKGYCLRKLNTDIINFLTPWAAGNTETISFSAKMYASSVINFIDELDYVDYVSDLAMKQYTKDDNGNKKFITTSERTDALSETELTTDHSILVSAPEHEIEPAG